MNKAIYHNYLHNDLQYLSSHSIKPKNINTLNKLNEEDIIHFDEPDRMYFYFYYKYNNKFNNYSIDIIKEHKFILLKIAIISGNIDLIKILMGIDDSYIRHIGPYLILDAAACGKLEIIKYLISENINIYKIVNYESALLKAIKNNNIRLVKFFIEEKKFFINLCINHIFDCPLFYAIKYYKLRIIKYLLSIGCNINIKDSSRGNAGFKMLLTIKIFLNLQPKYGPRDNSLTNGIYKAYKIFKFIIKQNNYNLKYKWNNKNLYEYAVENKLFFTIKYLKQLNPRNTIKWIINNKNKYIINYI